MTPLHQLLDRIRWDAVFGAARFEFGYYDRVARRIVRIDLRELSPALENPALLEFIDADGVAHSMPLHRIKEVYRDGVLIWRRVN